MKNFQQNNLLMMSLTSISPSSHVRNEQLDLKPSLTTVLQSGGWVTETSRSFHYWQPAPRWRLLS